MLNPQDDFSPNQLIKSLSEKIEQPDKFAHVFCEAAKSQKTIDEVLKEIIRKLLKHDYETIEHLKALQRQVDREDWRYVVKKVGLTGWSIIMVILGAIITALARHFIP